MPGARTGRPVANSASRARRRQPAWSLPACWHLFGRRPAPHTSRSQLGQPDPGPGRRVQPPGCEDGTMAERITVFLLDDHEIVRRGLLTCSRPRTTSWSSARRVRRMGRPPRPALDPDVAVPPTSACNKATACPACREIRSRHPRTACLILTSFSDDEALFEAIMAGASGYVLKQIRTTDLVDAVRRVAAGQNLLDPAVTARRARAPAAVPRRTNGSPGSVIRSARCWHFSPRA